MFLYFIHKINRIIMKRLTFLSLILIATSTLLTLQSCKTSSINTNNNYALGQMDPDKTPNIDGFWILKSLNNQASKDIFQGELPTMRVNLADTTINGYAGCNRYNGSFNYSGGIFSAPHLVSTRMMCMSDNQEAQYLSMLAKSNKISIVDGILTFTNNGRSVAQFTEGVDKAFLEGKWVLESMEGQDLNILFLTSENIPTLEFHPEEDGITGNAGCNKYRTSYKVNEQYITIEPIMSTRMACPNLEGENIFKNMMMGISKLVTTEKHLTFYKDGSQTLRFKKIQ